MADTYSQMDMHLVFAVKNREDLILPDFRNPLFKYIFGIIRRISKNVNQDEG